MIDESTLEKIKQNGFTHQVVIQAICTNCGFLWEGAFEIKDNDQRPKDQILLDNIKKIGWISNETGEFCSEQCLMKGSQC